MTSTGSEYAFFILDNERDEHGEFLALIAERGVAGYARTDWHWGTDRELAERLCSDRNQKSGMSEKDVAILIASTLIKPGKNYSVSILWGSDHGTDEEPNSPCYYEFDTQAELDAFLIGVDEATGWLDCRIVEREELENKE